MTQPTRNLIEPILGSSPLLLLFTILYIIVRFSLKKGEQTCLLTPRSHSLKVQSLLDGFREIREKMVIRFNRSKDEAS